MYLLFFNYNNMRTWLTESEQKKINDVYGGYSPMLLKFLNVGFDGQKFLNTLIEEYSKNISK